MAGLIAYSGKRVPLTTLGLCSASAPGHCADAEPQRWKMGAESVGVDECIGQGVHCRKWRKHNAVLISPRTQ